MVMDALRGYVQLANGLTEVTRKRAKQTAKALVQQTGADNLATGVTHKVSDLADEIVATSKSNRQLLQAIVANEVEGAVARLGFVRVEEVSALARRIELLERELADAAAEAAADAATSAVGGSATPTKKVAKKAPPVKAPVVRRAPAARTAQTPAASPAVKTAVKAPAKTAVKAPAKTAAKAPAKKAPAKKAAKKAPAKKTAATPTDVAKKVAAKKTAPGGAGVAKKA